MKNEYLLLTCEELTENRDFVDWVLRMKNQRAWEEFLAANPEFVPTAKKARKILELLRDSQDHLSENDASILWRNIERFDDRYKTRSRQIRYYKLMRYAAILIFALLVGGTVSYWVNTRNQRSYVFSANSDNRSGARSRLLLSDGTSVDLENKNSTIALSTKEQIVIDNNKVIDMSKKSNIDDSKMNEIVIPFGKKSQLLLEDGTKVWLNAGSRMAFPTKFSGKNREVYLEGEAYFEVAHNKDFPFLVNADEISIKVLGTKFNLSAYKTDQQLETTLIEGKVAVTKRSGLGFIKSETILAPNQKASYDKEQQSILVKNEPDTELSIAWTKGRFDFSQQSFNEVLNKLERYYNVKFQFDHGFSTSDLITGKLDLKDSIGQVMRALADVTNIQYQINGDKIYIEKAK